MVWGLRTEKRMQTTTFFAMYTGPGCERGLVVYTAGNGPPFDY